MVAEIKITKPVVCLALCKAPPNQAAMLNKPGMEQTAGKFGNQPRDFTYDVSRADEIYDCLEKVRFLIHPYSRIGMPIYVRIRPSPRAAVTWAHHAILAGNEKQAVYALVATVPLAIVFIGFQGMEYYQAPFTISDSIYGSTFFLATVFHGFHVIIGTLFLIICGIRQYLGHLTKEHHVGFEAAA
ncbi:hypothetical protein RYX36_008563, partial [Vicia faba]